MFFLIFLHKKLTPFPPSRFSPGSGISLSVWSSNARGRSRGTVTLEASPSKVAELQIGELISHKKQQIIQTLLF